MSQGPNGSLGGDARPLFSSTRPRIGAHATVEVSSTIQASGPLTGVTPEGRGTVDIGGRVVSGTLVPSMRRLHLSEPATPIEEPSRDEDPSPC
ncbi:hypothetical protein IQ03_01306 [Gemmobacter caeni]|uniref:Uncharacterized protein n=1 Tax=Gemmobacter caeni TaxID=589035 RepID=A0A2T6B8N4_9RHOB|nr:hypothetical protein [Gemmobacter caeni]PTX52441.1 hypothetical protein C8N34_102221 [Gemmobacter caeni]TWJ02888.1 hypothetical protein IQ03_01306 [Gemmobacter caeni]